MNLNLSGKRALVLAASRGLGYATALGLAREGVSLVICSRDEGRIGDAAKRIREATGATVDAVAADVGTGEEAARLVAHTVATFGGLDIVVHNAGGPPAGDFLSITEAQWQKAFDQNLMSLVRLVNAAVPELKKAGGGRILTIASSSIKQPIPGLVLSNALRTGVWGLVKTLARELGPHGIRINVVAPGRIQTERIEELDTARATRLGVDLAHVKQESIAAIPLGRLGTPEEFANLLVFLASDAGRYISGQAIIVDGGMTAAL
jgi:3-oxoacyl-[acyl-carrier protein] reductase